MLLSLLSYIHSVMCVRIKGILGTNEVKCEFESTWDEKIGFGNLKVIRHLFEEVGLAVGFLIREL